MPLRWCSSKLILTFSLQGKPQADSAKLKARKNVRLNLKIRTQVLRRAHSRLPLESTTNAGAHLVSRRTLASRTLAFRIMQLLF